MIRLVVLARGPAFHALLRDLAALEQLQVVAVLDTSQRLQEKLQFHQANALLLDLEDAGWNPVHLTEELMSSYPLALIGLASRSSSLTVEAFLRAGGVGSLTLSAVPGAFEVSLAEQVAVLAEVKVVRRRGREGESSSKLKLPCHPTPKVVRESEKFPFPDLIVVGSSTGGPSVLLELFRLWAFRSLPPVVVAQHISAGFSGSMVQWLASSSSLPCHIATQEQDLLAGHAYFAPDGRHIRIQAGETGFRADLRDSTSADPCCPSVNELFLSAAQASGRRCVGILLTGMGRDGADGLLAIREARGFTMTQSAQSCAVFGMPAEAEKLKASLYSLDPADLAEQTLRLLPP